jgi:Eisosome component PIL1
LKIHHHQAPLPKPDDYLAEVLLVSDIIYLQSRPVLLTHSISGHVFRRQAAGAFGPDLAKKLSQLVKMEKNVMRSMELVGRERMEVAVSLP